MKNYYELLDIPYNASITQIRSAYQFNISQFNNLPFFTDENIAQVKEYKKALYILSNSNLRQLYNIKLEASIQNNVDKEEFNYEPEVQGANTFDTFDTFDKTLNSSNIIGDIDSKNASEIKKNKLNANIIGERIFSLSHLNKIPVLNDFHLKLRKPENGRIEK
jgi:DnaJ-class molecular chaperone